MFHERCVGICAHSKRQWPDAEALFIKNFRYTKVQDQVSTPSHLSVFLYILPQKLVKMNKSLFTKFLAVLNLLMKSAVW